MTLFLIIFTLIYWQNNAIGIANAIKSHIWLPEAHLRPAPKYVARENLNEATEPRNTGGFLQSPAFE